MKQQMSVLQRQWHQSQRWTAAVHTAASLYCIASAIHSSVKRICWQWTDLIQVVLATAEKGYYETHNPVISTTHRMLVEDSRRLTVPWCYGWLLKRPLFICTNMHTHKHTHTHNTYTYTERAFSTQSTMTTYYTPAKRHQTLTSQSCNPQSINVLQVSDKNTKKMGLTHNSKFGQQEEQMLKRSTLALLAALLFAVIK